MTVVVIDNSTKKIWYILEADKVQIIGSNVYIVYRVSKKLYNVEYDLKLFSIEVRL